MVTEEGTPAARALVARSDRFIAPDLLTAEVVNALWRLERGGIISAAQQAAGLIELRGLIDEMAPLGPLASQALSIATSLGHPAYDCFYLALAQMRSTRVVTADRRLLQRTAGSPWAGLLLPLA